MAYEIVFEGRLDIIPSTGGFPTEVNCKQYDGDYTRQMKFTMYKNNEIWEIPETIKSVVIEGTKPNEEGFSYFCSWNGSVVTAPLMYSMTDQFGKVPFDVVFLDENNNRLGSARGYLCVEKSALQEELLTKSNSYQTVKAYADSAKYYEELSKSYAVGNTGIRSLENADNSEYYSELSRNYAEMARTYKGAPLTANTVSEMSDSERVYVYLGSETGYTNGNWYYYNGSSWVSGGVYNAVAVQTDDTLSVPDIPADAEAVGNAINKLSEAAMLYNFHLEPGGDAGAGDMNIIVLPSGKVVCCDSGAPNQENSIDAKMTQYGITHIDIMITTHFHGDHVGCFMHVADTYCDSTTDFYRCMDWDTTQIGYKKHISPAEYEAKITSLGADSYVPVQNQTVTVDDDCSLRFLNTDPLFLTTYYSSYSDTDIDNYMNPSINNLSLIVEITYKNRKILWTGDAEAPAQHNNVDYIGKVDVLKIPHHNWNMDGWHEFFEKACPEVAFFNRHNALDPVSGCPHYWDKIKMQCLGEIPTYQTLNDDVMMEIGVDNIKVLKGDLFTYQRSLSIYRNVGNAIMGKDIPYFDSDAWWWDNNNWSIADVLELYRHVPYSSTATVYTSSAYFTKFAQELTAMTGRSYSTYILLSKSNSLLLTPLSAQHLTYTFVYGFDYNTSSTWTNRYFPAYTQLKTLNLQDATELTSSADLFSLNAMGEYFASTNATAAAITNSPTTSAFRIEIGYSNGNSGRRYMRLIDCTGKEWYTFKNEGSTWQAWKVIVE